MLCSNGPIFEWNSQNNERKAVCLPSPYSSSSPSPSPSISSSSASSSPASSGAVPFSSFLAFLASVGFSYFQAKQNKIFIRFIRDISFNLFQRKKPFVSTEILVNFPLVNISTKKFVACQLNQFRLAMKWTLMVYDSNWRGHQCKSNWRQLDLVELVFRILSYHKCQSEMWVKRSESFACKRNGIRM